MSDGKREDEGFDGLVVDPVVIVEHEDYQGVRYHVLTLKSGVEVSVVSMGTLLRFLKEGEACKR